MVDAERGTVPVVVVFVWLVQLDELVKELLKMKNEQC